MPHRLRPIVAFLAVALLGACSQQDKKPRLPTAAVVGVWRSEAGADSAASVFELRTLPDGRAELLAIRNGRDTAAARGTWDGADSLLRVLVRQDSGVPRPTSILFAMRGNALAPTFFNGPTVGPDSLALGTRFSRRP